MAAPELQSAIDRAIAGEPAPVTVATIPAYWGEGATADSIVAWFVADRKRVVAEGGVVDEGFYERAIAKYAGMGGVAPASVEFVDGLPIGDDAEIDAEIEASA